MKFKNIINLTFGVIALVLSTTSCRDETFADYWDDSEYFNVTLNVGLEGMSTTRDGEEEGSSPKSPKIGGGSEIDMLIYAVYYDANKAKGITSDTPDWQAATAYEKESEKGKNPFPNHVPGIGQQIMNVERTIGEGNKQPITLTLKKGQEYQVVFWAQSSKTDAFVTNDLKKVQMKYKIMEEPEVVTLNDDSSGNSSSNNKEKALSVNNDEKRDAFCRSIPLTGEQSKQNITIYLKRPLAQINIGTRGFDFETITRNAEKKYLYSKIRINRAARYLNVVEDYVYQNTIEDDPTGNEDKEAFYTIDYEYNKIPAYWKMDIPAYPSYTIYDLEEGGAFDVFKQKHGELLNGDEKESFTSIYDQEEFLKVKLFDHEATREESGYQPEDEEGYYTYAGMGASGDETNNKQSEVFKYLSMCYILTPTSGSNTLTNLKMWIATDDEGEDAVEVVNLSNVPVMSNHRTNIVGSLLTAKAEMQIVVDQNFGGSKFSGDTKLSGEIVEGFYYDADNDEFQISSVNGLLFFQQLVNGDLKIRQVSADDNPEGAKIGDPYPYMDEEGRLHWLKSKSWAFDDLGEERAKLLLKGMKFDDYTDNGKRYQKNNVKASNGDNYTVYIWLDDNKWPVYKNFSFFDVKVKLMADIDLKGIEWIPIGFDCCSWDSSIGSGQAFKTNSQTNATNYRTLVKADNKTINLDHRRVFCGTFDGNGHTIYNLTTKQFGAEVLDYNIQYTQAGERTSDGPYDNVQWFGRGLFGLCGPGVVIKNLRLQNVDVEGNNGVAGLVAVVNSMGFEAKIDNCVIDQGQIIATPLYRNDYRSEEYQGRTHARGVYSAGIVGQFIALGNNAGVTNCEVRNVEIRGFRRIGGIIGSIADQGDDKMGNSLVQLDIKVEKNRVVNSRIICDQYTPFNYVWNEISAPTGSRDDITGMWKNGYGWGATEGFSPMSDIIVGGELNTKDLFSSTYVCKTYKTKDAFYRSYLPAAGNTSSNVQYSVLSARRNEKEPSVLTGKPLYTVRESEIGNISLEDIPMFSSLFVDEVNLTNNYYGEASLYTKINFKTVQLWRGKGLKYSEFVFPFNFPNASTVNYKEDDAKAGMYVETVYISGEKAPGGRSVITPTGVSRENDCVMYVTSRDRKQFEGKLKGLADDTNETLPDVTTIKDVVLRGSPYAWAGMLIAPNENMSKLVLKNVTIYDVYKTLALEVETPTGTNSNQIIQNYTSWPEENNIVLEISKSNFRGYTLPGDKWKSINYSNTTFEQGSETSFSSSKSIPLHKLYYEDESGEEMNLNGETKKYSKADMQAFKTCRVDAPTNFNNCFFKAPFFIDLSHYDNNKITFTKCYATSAYKNVEIDFDGIDKNKVDFIEVATDTKHGKTILRYYKKDDKSTETNKPGYLLKEVKSE